MSHERKCSAILIGLPLVLALTASAWGGADFVIGAAKVKAGTAFSGLLPVPGPDGTATAIPFTVINGARSGKVLALVAGVHAYEYPPILALYRLKALIDPKALRGTVVMVHIANLPSFKRRTIYYGPDDWKNLNRVFPGDANGTTSQRIAAVINDEIVGRADVLLDMHCGDGNEALIPYTYWMISGDKAFDARTRDLALAFGLPHIIIDDTRGRDLKDSKYLGNTAILRGKPAITTEAGFLGRSDEDDILRNVNGVLNVMRLLKMIGGTPQPVKDPVWIDKYEVVNSSADGLFYPKVDMGAAVAEGQIVGTLKDYWGKTHEDVKAPFAGLILYIIGTPPANKGEPLFEVGRIKK